MEIIAKNIPVQKTARYYIAGNPSDKTKKIWVVIHGYGQLAGNFIQQFDFIVNNETIIIAPEGLSRFYTGSAEGNNVGAGWMTKEDRNNEISDYITYLDSVLRETLHTANNKTVKISMLGFSQGVHTAARWFIHSPYNFDKLVLCSSDFPRDADFDKLKVKLKSSKMFYIYGDADGVIPQASFESSGKMLTEKDVNYEKMVFSGRHIVHQDTIKKLI
jgi:predicted esterase